MKEIKNGNGTILMISEDSYISVDKNGKNIMLRAHGKVLAFDSFDDLVDAIDINKATYVNCDNRR